MITGKRYVGQTNNIQGRINYHRWCVNNGDTRQLYVDIREYGWNNFLHVFFNVLDEEER
jgi:hypothetical protein